MAKPHSQWAGNSCHVHTSLRDNDGEGVFFDPDDEHGLSTVMRHFVGGILATMGELTALMAPTPNAYRRYSPYSWAGTSATWGVDNRSAGLRAIIDGPLGTRIEHRQPGGDVNPYIATAVTLAAGLYGLEEAIEPTDVVKNDVYAMPAGAVPGLPRTLDQALRALEGSKMARDWLGADFVEHYLAMKEAELEAQSAAVTDWEIARYLEAL
jgi:glutamine synthetase